MAQRTPEKYRDILRNVVAFIGIQRLLSIEDIGKQNPKMSLTEILDSMSSFGGQLDAANYQAHYDEYLRLNDFIEIGAPEYALQRLIDINYLRTRARDVIIPAQEEMLQSCLSSLENKYGKPKVVQLKRRLGIKKNHYH